MKLNFQVFSDGLVTYFYEVMVLFKAFQWPRGLTPTVTVAFNENDNEDFRFTQFGTRDENQDDGEVDSEDRSLVQDNPRKRKRNGINAKYNETIIATEKQKAKFLEEAIKNRQPENEDLLFFAAFCPTSTTNRPIRNCVSETASNKLLTSLLNLQLLQHSSTAHLHCSRRRLQPPHLLLTVYHQKELPRRLLRLRIPVTTTRFTSKCHPSAAHQYPVSSKVFCMHYFFLKH